MVMAYFKNLNPGRVMMMLIGNIFVGLGIAIFKLSGLGNDPFNGMIMGIADYIIMEYAVLALVINGLVFLLEIIFAKKLIGMGTIINAFLTGYIVTFFYDIFIFTIGSPELLSHKILTLCIGIVICCLGVSMYQSSNMGISPYDSMSLILTEKFPKVPYFAYRIFTDSICAAICFISGGIVGLGTLVTVVGFGPVVQFFNVHFSHKLLQRIDASYGKAQAAGAK